jgi:hypothetical protein
VNIEDLAKLAQAIGVVMTGSASPSDRCYSTGLSKRSGASRR